MHICIRNYSPVEKGAVSGLKCKWGGSVFLKAIVEVIGVFSCGWYYEIVIGSILKAYDVLGSGEVDSISSWNVTEDGFLRKLLLNQCPSNHCAISLTLFIERIVYTCSLLCLLLFSPHPTPIGLLCHLCHWNPFCEDHQLRLAQFNSCFSVITLLDLSQVFNTVAHASFLPCFIG